MREDTTSIFAYFYLPKQNFALCNSVLLSYFICFHKVVYFEELLLIYYNRIDIRSYYFFVNVGIIIHFVSNNDL